MLQRFKSTNGSFIFMTLTISFVALHLISYEDSVLNNQVVYFIFVTLAIWFVTDHLRLPKVI